MLARNTPEIDCINSSMYDYETKGARCNIIVKGKAKWVTNLDVPPDKLVALYERRWRIEIAYRLLSKLLKKRKK